MARNKLTKLFLFASIFFASTLFLNAQKVEINLNAYRGLFSFRGGGATSSSWIISYPFINTPTKNTKNPYGRRSGFSYAAEFQVQRLSERKNIYGLGISFEELTSKVTIYKVGVSGDPAYYEYPADGETKLKNTFITLNPFLGHRYRYRKLTLDLLAGADISFCLKSKEIGNATTSNKDYVTVENDKTKPLIDFRPRIQIKAQVNRLSFLTGYSFGLTNFHTQNLSKTYTSFFRLGLGYQLK